MDSPATPPNSTSETRPPKRRREGHDTDDIPAPSNFTQSPDFWMEDGNIILVGESVGYRVHQSVLASHSTIFRDMFQHSAPSKEETVDGCAVLNLQDTANDMYHLLRMMYVRRYGQEKSPFSLSAIYGLMRMATKYMADELRLELVEHLKLLFPSTFEDYCSPGRLTALPSNLNPMLGTEIALEFNVPIILPTALYLSAVLPLEAKLGGFEMADGSRVKPSFEALERILLFEHKWREVVDDADDEQDDMFNPQDGCPYSNAKCGGLSDSVTTSSRIWYSRLNEDVFLNMHDSSRGDALYYTCKDCVSTYRRTELGYKTSMWSMLPFIASPKWERWESIPRDAGDDGGQEV